MTSGRVHTRFERRASVIIHRLARAISGDDAVVLIPANVCPVVPLALLSAGRAFEFIDLDTETLAMDLAAVEARLGDPFPPVGAVLFVRTYGFSEDLAAPFGRLRALAPELLLIDDRCAAAPELDAAGADLQGADVALYSTGYAKYVDLGAGGFAHVVDGVGYDESPLLPQPGDLDAATAIYREHVRRRTPIYVGEPGGHELISHLGWLDGRPPDVAWRVHRGMVAEVLHSVTTSKAEKNAVYRANIPPTWQLDVPDHPWRFTIRVPDRDRLLRSIRDAGLIASDHYFPASTLFGGHAAPIAEGLHRDVLNLFNDHYIDLEQVRAVATVVARHERRPTD